MTIKFVRKTTYFDRLVFVVNKFFFYKKAVLPKNSSCK